MIGTSRGPSLGNHSDMVVIIPFVFCIAASAADRENANGQISRAFTYAGNLAGDNGGSACSHALRVFQQGIFAGRVAADDSLEGLVALDVVGDALEEGLVADGGGIVGVFGFGVGGFVCAGG
jgi:hypothetical protein